MRVQMITGFFEYSPCELTVSDGVLYINIDGKKRPVASRWLCSAALTRRKNGGSQLEFATKSERFEFLLADEQSCDEARGMLYELTKNDGRLELRMSAE